MFISEKVLPVSKIASIFQLTVGDAIGFDTRMQGILTKPVDPWDFIEFGGCAELSAVQLIVIVGLF